MSEEVITKTTASSLTIDLLALGISIIAVIVAIIAIIIQRNSSKKINDINLTAEFCKSIFREFLIYKIPTAFNQLYCPQNKLAGTSDLQTELNRLRQKTQFFEFIDNSFYEKLKSECQELEDYLVNNEKRTLSPVEYANTIETIRTRICKIYMLLNDKYING